MVRNGIGLGLLPPPLPLFITVAMILRVQFAPIDELITVHLPVVLILLALNFRFRFFPFFILSIITTFGYLFVGNAVFSHIGCVWSFSIISSRYGCAILAAMPRTIMLLYGFAWLNSGDAESFTRSFTRLALPFGRSAGPDRYIAGAAQYFSQLASENATLEYALKFHLTVRQRRLSISTRVQITWLKLGAIIFKMFYAIPDFAYALESRYARSATISLSPEIVSIELIGFRPRRRAATMNFAVPLKRIGANYIDLSELSDKVSTAVLDVLAGVVPHLRGAVAGTISMAKSENFLAWSQDRKFRYVRYVGGTSSSRQLLGPTVQFEMQGSTTSRRGINRALKYWDLNGDRRKRVQELSGGQRVRLALASAMVSDAQIILLDDVEGQLDTAGRTLLEKWIETERSDTRRLFVGRSARGMESPAVSQSPGHVSAAIAPAIRRPVIRVEHIRLVRGGRTLLRDFSHSFQEGTITVLTGPNGAGKTSLGLLIGGAIPPARGRIWRNVPVGMSFQNPLEQVFRFTVGDELEVRPSLGNAEFSARSSHVHGSLGLMRLSGGAEVVDLGAAPLRALSIYAMLFKTGFLILDEPLNGLSADEGKLLINTVEDLRDRGVASLVITHDPATWNGDDVLRLGVS